MITQEPKVMVTVGEILRSRRAEAGLSLQEVAERVGCARSYLSMIENGSRKDVSAALLSRLGRELGLYRGELERAAAWEGAPASVKRELKGMRAAAGALRAAIGRGSLDEAYRNGKLHRIVDGLDQGLRLDAPVPIDLPIEVPLINSVAAGYPRGFTDLGYPARVADEYVRTPDVLDPDAFAARVVGDSMEPDYREGDIVVFSPAREIRSGMDCFVRFEKDEEATFKRVALGGEGTGLRAEGRGEEHADLWITLVPLNMKYPERRVHREAIAGMYAAVSVTRRIGG